MKVLDYYAASEGVPIIQQCIHGRYHLREETGIFEFIRSDGTAAEPGDTAELVATAFCQWKTILIRYRTGDLMTLPEGTEAPCPCGRPSPWVKSIVGRQEDLVVTPDGRTIGMFSYRTLKHVSGILEAQIVQERPGLFRVIAVLDGSMGEPVVEAETRRVFSSVLGFEPTIGFEYVIAIPRGPNGKFRSVIRNFKQH